MAPTVTTTAPLLILAPQHSQELRARYAPRFGERPKAALREQAARTLFVGVRDPIRYARQEHVAERGEPGQERGRLEHDPAVPAGAGDGTPRR